MNPQQTPLLLTLTSIRAHGQNDKTPKPVQFVLNSDSFQIVDTTNGSVVYQSAYSAVKFSAIGSGRRLFLQGRKGSSSAGDVLFFELPATMEAGARKRAALQLVQDLRQRGMATYARIDSRSPWERSVQRAQQTFPLILLIVTFPIASQAIGTGAAIFWCIVFALVAAGVLEVIKRVMRKHAGRTVQ